MFVGSLAADLHLGDVRSLKQKRSVVRPIVAEVQRRSDPAPPGPAHCRGQATVHQRHKTSAQPGLMPCKSGDYSESPERGEPTPEAEVPQDGTISRRSAGEGPARGQSGNRFARMRFGPTGGRQAVGRASPGAVYWPLPHRFPKPP